MAQSLREQLHMAHSMIGMPYEHNLRAEITSLCEQSPHRPELLEAAVVLLDSYGNVSCGTRQPSVYVAVLEACEAARTPSDAFAELLREQPKNPLLAIARKLSLKALGDFCKSVKGYGPESDAVTKLAVKLVNTDFLGVTKNMSDMVRRLEVSGDLLGAYCIVRESHGQTRNGLIYDSDMNIFDIKSRVKALGEQQLVDRDLKAAYTTGKALCTANGSPKDGFNILDTALYLELIKAQPDWKFVAKAAEEVANFRHLSYAPHSFSGQGEEFAELREVRPQQLPYYLDAANKAQQASAPEAAYGLLHVASVVGHHERDGLLGRLEILQPFMQQMFTRLALEKPELGAKFLALGAYSKAPLSAALLGQAVATDLLQKGENASAALYLETAGRLARLVYTGPHERDYDRAQKESANQLFVACDAHAQELRSTLEPAKAPLSPNTGAEYLAVFKAHRLVL
jgi:hypothetical protein